ncbi:MAG: magnesium transporter, partial [Herpetosiphonaceae bacterium]|nr:magnesium transporter [Herpetosiphonaceae bacterium]
TILRSLASDVAQNVLQATAPELAHDIRALLVYPAGTAGSIMSLDFLTLPISLTQAGAVAQLQQQIAAPSPYAYAVDADGAFQGLISLHRLLTAPPAMPLADVLQPTELTVPPTMDQEQVMTIFARYDVLALPVVSPEPGCRLLGVITPDDVIDVFQAAQNQEVAHLAGSDAQELEQKSPVQVAKLRLPWIMSTLFIELLAGFVIRIFNGTLQQYILLASFMPIISAISGNTGLQSAAIIIRGLSSGLIQLANWRQALARQVATTALLGAACGLVLGVIGATWAHNWVFGLVILLGMFFAVNIAGIVGTIVPLLSKRAGFDPALTAGPFETAFQDVVGISIFLGLATALLRFLR